MNKRLNYSSIRQIAYVLPILLMVMGLRYGVIYAFLDTERGRVMYSLFLNSSSESMLVFLLDYLLLIAFFVNIYRLSDMERWWYRAGYLLMFSLIVEAALRVFEWQITYVSFSVPFLFLVVFAGILPEVLRFIGLIFFFLGVRRIRRKMREEFGKRGNRTGKEDRTGKGIIQMWISAECILILSIPMYIAFYFFLDDVSVVFLKWLGVVEAAIYLVASALLGRRIFAFCQEYYLYLYNRG